MTFWFFIPTIAVSIIFQLFISVLFGRGKGFKGFLVVFAQILPITLEVGLFFYEWILFPYMWFRHERVCFSIFESLFMLIQFCGFQMTCSFKLLDDKNPQDERLKQIRAFYVSSFMKFGGAQIISSLTSPDFVELMAS